MRRADPRIHGCFRTRPRHGSPDLRYTPSEDDNDERKRKRGVGLVQLRDATAADLDFIVAQESRPEFAAFICNWGGSAMPATLRIPTSAT